MGTKSLAIAAMALTLVAGCNFFVEEDGWSGGGGAIAARPWVSPYAQDVELVDARMTGDLGRVRVDGLANQSSGYVERGAASFVIHVPGTRGGAGMAMVDVFGPVDFELVPGLAIEGGSEGARFDETVVTVTGCSGPSMGDWEFDVPADRVDLTTREGSTPDLVAVDFVARLRGDELHGSFEVPRVVE